MESNSSRTYTANEVIAICNEDNEFEESDNEFSPWGDFTDANGSEMLYPSELLAPSCVPFLTFTHENRQPAVRNSVLNTDEDCIAEGKPHCKDNYYW